MSHQPTSIEAMRTRPSRAAGSITAWSIEIGSMLSYAFSSRFGVR